MTTMVKTVDEDGVIVATLDNSSIIEAAANAEKRIEAVNKIKNLALRVTNPSDWVDMGGKPYLQVSGSEKIGRLFGVSWTVECEGCEGLKDGHYQYTYKGKFWFKGVSIEAIGTRSSSDPFFCKRKGTVLPAEEVDRANVKKGAYTNCIGNGITRLLGIRNATYEDLNRAGVQIGTGRKVDYRQNGSAAQEDSNPMLATVKQISFLSSKLKQAAKNDNDLVVKIIKKHFGEDATKENLPKKETSDFLNNFDNYVGVYLESFES